MPLPLSSFLSFSLTVMFNFILHDQRKGPIWNIIMWTSLFLGQGVIICLYSQEWYAQRYCPLEEVTLAAFFFMHFGAPVLPPFHVMFWFFFISAFILWVTEASLLELSQRPDVRPGQTVIHVWTTAEDHHWPVKIWPALCYCHNFRSFVFVCLFYCSKVVTASAKMFFIVTAKWCLTFPFYVLKKWTFEAKFTEVHIKSHVNSFICIYYLFFKCIPI